jgi:ATP-dependent Clp protease, protease subunit
MSLRTLPAIQAFQRPEGMSWDAPADALARWAGPASAQSEDPADISIYDVIGEDPWTGGGWTARRIAGVLRSVGAREVTVSINSPGGDVFEGIAIFNLLREHKARVDVRVMGLAASAASLIAMAGDSVAMGRGAMMMVHNAWGVAVGNRHDMRAAADVLQPIDDAMAEIYAARTTRPKKKMAEMMDAETWMSSGQAVEGGFADSVMDDAADAAAAAALRPEMHARHQLDVVLAKAGMSRAERRKLLREVSTGGTPGAAAAPATHDAGLSGAAAELQRLIANIRG